MGKYDKNITTISIWDSLDIYPIFYLFQKVKLHYVEAGSKDQPLMLFLHGFPDCWISWRYQVPFFSEYFRVVSLDLKGFGDSDKPISRGQYHLETILEELEQFILALGVSSCILVGHDIGALLGWFLAKQNPSLIDKFVSISCSHPNVCWNYLPSNGIHSSNWIKFVQCPGLPELDAMKSDLKIIKDYHQYLHEKYTQDKEILEAYKYTFSRKEDWSGPLNYFRTLPFHRIQGKEQIEVPTLLVTGNKDNFVNLEGIVMSTDYCKKFFVKIIENTGHYPHQEDPENFNKVLIKFLKVKPTPRRNKLGDRSPSKRLMDKMFGAMSSTVKYGNSVLDSVNKRTNGVVSIPSSFGLPPHQND
ncbi:epoxide hydrolase [Holotrichia oblita]|uniref:Epoxide hydrolase n=1 Tax=Holotrichia oblita TaxID=644536 RepID=A0ACB9ST14_HOLOL|nr:epoxide hydrolase [Holotrichia oblita]